MSGFGLRIPRVGDRMRLLEPVTAIGDAENGDDRFVHLPAGTICSIANMRYLRGRQKLQFELIANLPDGSVADAGFIDESDRLPNGNYPLAFADDEIY